eukprot:16200244-Heterocapsa_arctica.AAC.2
MTLPWRRKSIREDDVGGEPRSEFARASGTLPESQTLVRRVGKQFLLESDWGGFEQQLYQRGNCRT